jgi:ribose/xylose/arabinose/galactoside ABC-type transport system permease subunit
MVMTAQNVTQLKLQAFFILFLDGIYVQLQAPMKQLTITMGWALQPVTMVVIGSSSPFGGLTHKQSL